MKSNIIKSKYIELCWENVVRFTYAQIYLCIMYIYAIRCINNKKVLFACTLYLDQQPSVEQPQQEEPPAEIQDITPRKEEVHGEDPVNRDEEEEKDPFEGKVYLCVMP